MKSNLLSKVEPFSGARYEVVVRYGPSATVPIARVPIPWSEDMAYLNFEVGAKDALIEVRRTAADLIRTMNPNFTDVEGETLIPYFANLWDVKGFGLGVFTQDMSGGDSSQMIIPSNIRIVLAACVVEARLIFESAGLYDGYQPKMVQEQTVNFVRYCLSLPGISPKVVVEKFVDSFGPDFLRDLAIVTLSLCGDPEWFREFYGILDQGYSEYIDLKTAFGGQTLDDLLNTSVKDPRLQARKAVDDLMKED